MLTSHDKQSAWVLVAFNALMCWFTCHTSNKVMGLHCTQHYKHFTLTTTGNDCTLAMRLVWLGGLLQNSLIIFYGIATDDSIIWRDCPTLAIFWSLAVHHSHQRSVLVSTTTTTSKGRTINWLSTVPVLFSPWPWFQHKFQMQLEGLSFSFKYFDGCPWPLEGAYLVSSVCYLLSNQMVQ